MQIKAKLRTKVYISHKNTCIDKNIFSTSIRKETTIDVYETLHTNCKIHGPWVRD